MITVCPLLFTVLLFSTSKYLNSHISFQKHKDLLHEYSSTIPVVFTDICNVNSKIHQKTGVNNFIKMSRNQNLALFIQSSSLSICHSERETDILGNKVTCSTVWPAGIREMIIPFHNSLLIITLNMSAQK